MVRAREGKFKPGIDDANFDAAATWAENLGWEGPFILSADDTKIVAALRSYHNGSNWRLGGVHGVVHTFSSYEELLKLGKIEHGQLAEKVWTMMQTTHSSLLMGSWHSDAGLASSHSSYRCPTETHRNDAAQEQRKSPRAPPVA